VRAIVTDIRIPNGTQVSNVSSSSQNIPGRILGGSGSGTRYCSSSDVMQQRF